MATLIQVIAVVCFLFAWIPVPPVEPHRTRLIAAGLMFWAIVPLLPLLQR